MHRAASVQQRLRDARHQSEDQFVLLAWLDRLRRVRPPDRLEPLDQLASPDQLASLQPF